MTVCFSSLALERVNIWRNPQGKEEDWSGSIRYVSLFKPIRDRSAKYWEVQLAKAAIGQCASFIILGIAVIETVSYTALTAVLLTFSAYNDAPYAILRELLSSSFFTILWVFSKLQFNCLQLNFREQKALSIITSAIKATSCFFLGGMFQNEPTHEAFARKKYMPKWFFRSKDRETMIQKINPGFSKEWIQNYILDQRKLEFLKSVEDDPILLKDLFLQEKFFIARQQQNNNHADEDEVMYQCAIDLNPLTENSAVQDPTTLDGKNPTFYNEQSILQWLREQPISPITRLPLYPNELIYFDQMNPRHQERIREIQRENL